MGFFVLFFCFCAGGRAGWRGCVTRVCHMAATCSCNEREGDCSVLFCTSYIWFDYIRDGGLKMKGRRRMFVTLHTYIEDRIEQAQGSLGSSNNWWKEPSPRLLVPTHNPVRPSVHVMWRGHFSLLFSSSSSFYCVQCTLIIIIAALFQRSKKEKKRDVCSIGK